METWDNTISHMESLMALKKEIENNKLCNRRDVQILQEKLQQIQLELSFAKDELTKAKSCYDNARKTYIYLLKQSDEHRDHLKIISSAHTKQQENQIVKLRTALNLA